MCLSIIRLDSLTTANAERKCVISVQGFCDLDCIIKLLFIFFLRIHLLYGIHIFAGTCTSYAVEIVHYSYKLMYEEPEFSWFCLPKSIAALAV
mgnify:CR=1 FL=1